MDILLTAGEKLSNHGPLTMLKSEDYVPQAIAGEPDHVSAVDSAAHTSPPPCLPPQRESLHDVHGGEEIVDHESHGDDHAHEDLETFAADMDEKLRLLAMTPWIQAYGELRAEEEQKLANVCTAAHIGSRRTNLRSEAFHIEASVIAKCADAIFRLWCRS